MREERADVAVIGGGPAGLAAARAAADAGASALVIERNAELGGVLMQCIHPGFGLKRYGEELTGPEYASRWIGRLDGIRVLTETMVAAVEPGFRLLATGAKVGVVRISARSVVLAMGCRERTRGAIAIPGRRPAGVMTAGTAQRLVNMDGYLPGRRFAILGSGDIGMIMARRLVWEGAEVTGVYELLPYLSGLRRNYVQCLEDQGVALHLGHTVTEIHGRRRLTGVTVCRADESLCPIPATAFPVAADTLLLSVGLIPENELTRALGVEMDAVTGGPVVDNLMETTVPGLFAAGNVVQVHDLADDVSAVGEVAGAAAASHALGVTSVSAEPVLVTPGENVRSALPHHLRIESLGSEPVELLVRVRRPLESACQLRLSSGGEVIEAHRLDYARPGEMIAARLGRKAIAALEPGGRLVVEVAPE